MDSAAAFPASIDVQHTPTDGNAAISFEHHLSELAKARRPSPLKSFAKFQGVPGLISLYAAYPYPGLTASVSQPADHLIRLSIDVRPDRTELEE